MKSVRSPISPGFDARDDISLTAGLETGELGTIFGRDSATIFAFFAGLATTLFMAAARFGTGDGRASFSMSDTTSSVPTSVFTSTDSVPADETVEPEAPPEVVVWTEVLFNTGPIRPGILIIWFWFVRFMI